MSTSLRKNFAQRGVAVIETALTLPLILMVLFGTINYGIALYNKAVITNASREAARFGVVYSSSGISASAVADKAKAYCADKLISFGNSPVASVTVTTPGEDVLVNVSYQFQSVASGLIPGMSSLMTLSAKTQMKREV